MSGRQSASTTECARARERERERERERLLWSPLPRASQERFYRVTPARTSVAKRGQKKLEFLKKSLALQSLEALQPIQSLESLQSLERRVRRGSKEQKQT